VEGTEEQRQRYLPPILKGDEIWCQGFSEPNAGSDLAALKTKAVRDGDEYVLTGQKIWTSHADVADNCEIIVRTGPDGHKGITWLVMAMDTPGIQIRPLRTIARTTEFAELFLDEVRVPVANRVGEENDGWRVAMVTFGFERGTAFLSELLQSMELLRQLRDAASHTGLWDDLEIRRRIGTMGAELDALWALVRRNVSESSARGPGASVFKLAFSELRQRIGELGMEVIGSAGLVWDDVEGPWNEAGLHSDEIVPTWAHGFSRTIAAGTSQIQRNIIAERILGLPR
jgi:alkylation response protein AidB-like acyl-CoA dehydrogenase